MPKIGTMFPSKYLQAEDLDRNQITIVTIARVYAQAANQRVPGEDPEINYMIQFHEFRKPMGLRKLNAKAIADVLGIDDTDHWSGKRIGITPGSYISFGEVKPCINVDIQKPPQLEPQSHRPHSGLIRRDLKALLPRFAIDRALEKMHLKEKTWDDFLKWAKAKDAEILRLAFGCDFDSIPAAISPAIKAYLDELHAPVPDLPPPAAAPKFEAFDPATGEVLATKLVVNDEDIPF